MGDQEMPWDLAGGDYDQLTEYTARFCGGPLDGRRHPVSAPAEGQVVTHVFLHDGPKIESRYQLGKDDSGYWAYYLVD